MKALQELNFAWRVAGLQIASAAGMQIASEMQIAPEVQIASEMQIAARMQNCSGDAIFFGGANCCWIAVSHCVSRVDLVIGAFLHGLPRE